MRGFRLTPPGPTGHFVVEVGLLRAGCAPKLAVVEGDASPRPGAATPYDVVFRVTAYASGELPRVPSFAVQPLPPR